MTATGPQVTRHVRLVHGHRRAYLTAGSGPPLLLVHGLGDSSRTWQEAVPLLARSHTVIAPDLLGHGDSDKPRADYSLGGFANGLRDLLVLLDVPAATVVGHSLGGGVALQFAYQYPERTSRLVLVASGGLGAEVSSLLRAATLPGAGLAIAAGVRPVVRRPLLLAARLAARGGLVDSHDVEETAQVLQSLADPATRQAFLRTLHSVVDLRGQAVSSRDRLYLTAEIPTLMVWGGRDPVVPLAHARQVAAQLPGVQLEVLPRAGHVPHRHDPAGFVRAVTAFVERTAPAVHDAARWRARMAGG